MKRRVSFKNDQGLTLRGVVYEPRQPEAKASIVCLHGFPGSIKGRTAKRLGPALVKKGYRVLQFNFSGTPDSDGKFEQKLMSREVKDTKAAIDFFLKKYPSEKLVLFGHSTGAIDAGLYAHKDKRVKGLVLSGCVGKLSQAVRYDFTDEQVREFWTKGYASYTARGHWSDGLRIKKAFYDEFFTLDLPGSIAKYRGATLVVHGNADDAVPVKHAKEAYTAARKPKRLVIIPGADHAYSGRKSLGRLVAAVDEFVKTLLKKTNK